MNKPEEPLDEEYELMAELEELESLKEQMEELGVTSIAEIEQRIQNLHQQLDKME